MRTSLTLIPALAVLIACTAAHAFGPPRIRFTSDLSDVAGCRFLGPVRSPPRAIGSHIQDDYANYYYEEFERRLLIRGVTHLYILNRSAHWGGAQAFGSAYTCISQ